MESVLHDSAGEIINALGMNLASMTQQLTEVSRLPRQELPQARILVISHNPTQLLPRVVAAGGRLVRMGVV
jgi:hypothetical protein